MTQSGEETGQFLLILRTSSTDYPLKHLEDQTWPATVQNGKCYTLQCFELTVCWETGMEAARLRKEERYAPLLESCREQGWTTTCLPFEVGVRGFVGKRTLSLLKQLGFNRLESAKLARCIEETVENASRFIQNKKDVA